MTDFNTKKQPMTLDEHLELADYLAIIFFYLDKVFEIFGKHYCQSHPVFKQFFRFMPGILGGAWCRMVSALDDDYHKLITDDQFKIHGHIYYDLSARYENLKRRRRNRK